VKWSRTWFVGAAWLAAVVQAQGQVAAPERLPAEPPITGVLWTVVLPIILFGISFWAAYALYRRFSK
jgi:hypothetical protein